MAGRPASGIFASFFVIVVAGILAGCSLGGLPKDLKPVPRALTVAMHDQGMDENAPIFIRIFKEELELEVWKQKGDGQYALLKTYSICQWSGELGPKKVEGDRQAPEGFYTVTPAQMNPQLRILSLVQHRLSERLRPIAWPHRRQPHGARRLLVGGVLLDDRRVGGEIFALARDAFKGGQRNFQVQAFPFHMTAENMAKHADNPNMDFWRMLKVGYDSFEITRTPPKVDVCDKHYVFDADAGTATFDASRKCPAYKVPELIASALAKKQAADDVTFKATLASLRGGGAQVATAPSAVGSTAPPQARATVINRPAREATTATTAGSPTASVVAAVPPRPAVPAPAPKPPAVAAANAKPPTAPQSAAAVTAGSSDPIGVLVDRKFWWDDVPLPAAPGA